MELNWKILQRCPVNDLDVYIYVNNQKIAFSDLTDEDARDIWQRIKIQEPINRYHEEWLRSGSISRADLIRHAQRIQFSNYGEIEIKNPMDWALGSPGRNNLSWQLHSMFYLKDLVKAHLDTNDDWYIHYAIGLIKDWSESNISDCPPSPFSWNDHSTAYRLLAITMLLIHCIKHDKFSAPLFRMLFGIIIRHQLVLADEKFYSKGTNHGLDQTFFLYISLTISSASGIFEPLRALALSRLEHELSRSFSKEWVHSENSPEYHDLIFSNTLRIHKLVHELDGVSIIEDFDGFTKGGLRFLTYIVRPDGCWPPIGDSTVRGPKSRYIDLSGVEGYQSFSYTTSKGQRGSPAGELNASFPDAGYFVMQSDPTLLTQPNRIHAVFKCGFLNHYHRQDDDNHFVIYGLGEEWLTDGGLYLHDAKDAQREYVRSHMSHNVLAPIGIKPNRGICPTPKPRIVAYSINPSNPYCEGMSGMFEGFTYRRKLSYNGKFSFICADSMESPAEYNDDFYLYWQIPDDKSVFIEENVAVIRSNSTRNRLRITFNSKSFLSLEVLTPERGFGFCHRSVTYGVLEPVQVLRVKLCNSKPLKVLSTLTFQVTGPLI